MVNFPTQPFIHPLPNDQGVLNKMYEKFKSNPLLPFFICGAIYGVFTITQKRFSKGLTTVEFKRTMAAAPLLTMAAAAAWYHGTSIRDQQYIRDED